MVLQCPSNSDLELMMKMKETFAFLKGTSTSFYIIIYYIYFIIFYIRVFHGKIILFILQVNLTPQDDQKPRTLGNLLHWIKENLLQERPELFLKDPAAKELDVRPGILVLVNESDWELCGQTDYELEVRKFLQL